jgi:surface antigen
MRLKTASAVLLALLFVAGCETYPYGAKQTAGGVLGAAGGGLLGAQFGSGTGQLAATAAGVFIGALLGSEVGRSMDDVDRLKAEQAINQAHAAPIGNTIAWNNAESGNSGTVTPTRDGTSDSGEYCREFQQTVVIGGKTEEGYGVACRQPDGTWRIREPA